MKRYRDSFVALLLALADLSCLNLVAVVAIYVRFYIRLPPYFGGRPPWNTLLGYLGLTHLILFPSLILAGAYCVPRRWGMNEALPAIARALLVAFPVTTVMVFVFRLSATARGNLVTPSRFVVLSVWGGLFFGLVSARLLAGRVQLALYQRGVGLRRAVIAGDDAEAARVAERIERNPWLGERVLGCVGHTPEPALLGNAEELADAVKRHGADVIWLAPPADADGSQWLPSLLFAADARGLTWRMLPDDFERFAATGLSNLTQAQRELFYGRVRHDLVLPTLRIAMLGSRGVPASYGGVETYVEEVGAHLAAGGAQVAVYCHAKYVAARGKHRGMELRFMPAIRTKHLEAISHTFLATLHALLREEEVIHYQALGPSTLAWLPRLFRRKAVVTVQGLDWQRAKWGRLARLYLKFGEWAAVHFPHCTIVVSRTLADYYAEHHGRRAVYIPNGFALPVHKDPELIKELGLDKDNYILFVGRLVPEKGCHTLIRAFANVRTDKLLVFAGQANYEDRYYQRLEEETRGLSGVRFVGFVRGDVLRELYSNAYLVVHPSEVEGLSISLLEALSYGNCLLVSDTPENLEAVQDAAHSFQVGDETDLAQKLQWLLDRPDHIEAMRDRARSRFPALVDWSAVAAATQEVYEFSHGR